MKELISYETRKSVYDKVSKYTLNPEHKKGWTKGRWFMLALGFDPEKPDHVKMLARQIRFNAADAEWQDGTEYGERYSLLLSITGPNGRTVSGVRTRWQLDKDKDYIRLLNILPPKRR